MFKDKYVKAFYEKTIKGIAGTKYEKACLEYFKMVDSAEIPTKIEFTRSEKLGGKLHFFRGESWYEEKDSNCTEEDLISTITNDLGFVKYLLHKKGRDDFILAYSTAFGHIQVAWKDSFYTFLESIGYRELMNTHFIFYCEHWNRKIHTGCFELTTKGK